jgi:voltage-gated potassium channel
MTTAHNTKSGAKMSEKNISTANGSENKDSSYDLFILALTLLSLVTVAVMAMPWVRPATKDIAFFVDTLICMVFLIDFVRSLVKAPRKLEYLKWGWMDLLGSLPAWPMFRFFRLWRFVRAIRILRRTSMQRLWRTVVERPAGSSLMLLTLFGIVLLGLASYFVLVAEIRDPDANITSSVDAIWWSIVSVTTVGYGDRYPVTESGRIVAIFLMIGGIGLFSVLTSYLSSTFIGAGDEQENELREVRRELTEVKQVLDELSQIIHAQQRSNT